MQIVVLEILNYFYTNYKDELVKKHILKGKTIEDCFKQMYALKRSGRYDNARRYEFADKDLEKPYVDWKYKNENIEMYYGSATVD